MKISIVGAAGYTGGMLIRILSRHPHVSLAGINCVSSSHAGEPVELAHPDLIGKGLSFLKSMPADNDVIFLCTAHGKAAEWMASNDVGGATVIDLSNDHRLNSEWTYGLPEVYRDAIKASKKIANPGCFATTIELGLLRLGEHNQLNEHVVVTATTGSTGAGQAPSPTTHFSWRANNLSVYKAFTHQHLAEIEMVLGMRPVFIPQRGDFPRGIHAACVVKSKAPEEKVREHYRERFADHPFVHIVDDLPDVKRAVGTNNVYVGFQSHDGHILVVSVLDNLIKGASGQAVQNMNLACGFDETAGLDLVGLGY